MSLLDRKIVEKLEGNEGRVVELFKEDGFFDELVKAGTDSDWHHYEPKTLDGWYFIRVGSGFSCYQQERGAIEGSVYFDNVFEAATHFYKKTGYIKTPKRSVFVKVSEKLRNIWFLYK